MSECRDFDLGALAHHVKLALERSSVISGPRRMKICSMYGCELRATRPMAEPSMGVSRQPSTVQPFLARDALQNAFALQPLLLLHRQKDHAHAVLARLRQREAQPGALAREKLVRNLNQHARAIAGFRIAAASAAVRQIDQNLNALENDVVRFLALDVGYEADAARVVLVGRIVKPLGCR